MSSGCCAVSIGLTDSASEATTRADEVLGSIYDDGTLCFLFGGQGTDDNASSVAVVVTGATDDKMWRAGKVKVRSGAIPVTLDLRVIEVQAFRHPIKPDYTGLIGEVARFREPDIAYATNGLDVFTAVGLVDDGADITNDLVDGGVLVVVRLSSAIG